MEKKIKHNKLRNTYLIFRSLTDCIVTELLKQSKEIKNNPATKILKEYFNSSSLLYKELVLYKSMLVRQPKIENTEKYIECIIDARKNLPEDQLNELKYNLIGDIKRKLGSDFLTESLGTQVPNYKEVASIYQLFEYVYEDNPVKYYTYKSTLIEHLQKEEKQQPKPLFVNESKSIKRLAVKRLIENYNTTYSAVFSEKQKYILSLYINNPNKLASTLKEEFFYVKSKIKELKERFDDVTKIKLTQLESMISEVDFTPNRKNVANLLRFYALIEEASRDYE